ncbi:MAG: peptidoglycan-binding domain-containing protein, partial [Crocosphaera sp.]
MSDPITIIINEFSRKFDEPKLSLVKEKEKEQEQEKYVSGGFNKEIGFRTADVPPEIEKAIKDELLRINDNYPFALGEEALVARDMGKYCILAVATNGSDDGNRPLICYRYFWLENIDKTDFDGIATLLKWWEEKEKPYCEIKPWPDYEQEISENGEDFYETQPIDKKYSEQFQQQTQTIVNEITEQPHLFTFFKKEISQILPSYWGLHALVLQLNSKYKNADIAWTWNTSVIDKPSNFTLICCADQNNLDLQKPWVSSYKRLIIRPIDEPIDTPQPAPNPNVPNSPSSNNKLKQELIEIAKKNQTLKPTDIKYIVYELNNSDSREWDYSSLIDLSSYKYKLEEIEQKLTYILIILLLNPQGCRRSGQVRQKKIDLDINIKNFITEIIPKQTPNKSRYLPKFRVATQGQLSSSSTSPGPVIPQTRVAVATMGRFLYYCKKSLSEESYKRLKRNVYEIINQLFLKIISDNVEEKYFQAIKKILVDDSEVGDDFSLYHFKAYLRGYENKLLKWLNDYYKPETTRNIENVNNNNNIDNFCKQVITDLIAYEQKKDENVPYAPKVAETVFTDDDQSKELDQNEPRDSESQIINKTSTTQTKPFPKFSKYQKIAQILHYAGCYNLSALFYQLSLGFVPESLYIDAKRTDFVEIIKLTSKQEDDSEKKNNPPEKTLDDKNFKNYINFFVRNPYRKLFTNALIGLLLLGIGTGGGVLITRFFFSPSFTVEETQPFEQKLNYYRKLSQDGVSERNTAQIKDLLIQDVKKINNNDTGISNIYPFPRDNKAEKAKELQKEFIEQRKATLKDLLAYSYIASLTPKIDQTLSKKVLEEMTATKASPENIAATKENIQVKETVKKVSATMQPILLSLGFYKIPSFTNTWDQETSNAIKKFQIHYKLPATGNLDQ